MRHGRNYLHAAVCLVALYRFQHFVFSDVQVSEARRQGKEKDGKGRTGKERNGRKGNLFRLQRVNLSSQACHTERRLLRAEKKSYSTLRFAAGSPQHSPTTTPPIDKIKRRTLFASQSGCCCCCCQNCYWNSCSLRSLSWQHQQLLRHHAALFAAFSWQVASCVARQEPRK